MIIFLAMYFKLRPEENFISSCAKQYTFEKSLHIAFLLVLHFVD